MFTLTTVTCWLVALGGLALAVAHLATTGLDPAAGLLMTAGMARTGLLSSNPSSSIPSSKSAARAGAAATPSVAARTVKQASVRLT